MVLISSLGKSQRKPHTDPWRKRTGLLSQEAQQQRLLCLFGECGEAVLITTNASHQMESKWQTRINSGPKDQYLITYVLPQAQRTDTNIKI